MCPQKTSESPFNTKPPATTSPLDTPEWKALDRVFLLNEVGPGMADHIFDGYLGEWFVSEKRWTPFPPTAMRYPIPATLDDRAAVIEALLSFAVAHKIAFQIGRPSDICVSRFKYAIVPPGGLFDDQFNRQASVVVPEMPHHTALLFQQEDAGRVVWDTHTHKFGLAVWAPFYAVQVTRGFESAPFFPL